MVTTLKKRPLVPESYYLKAFRQQLWNDTNIFLLTEEGNSVPFICCKRCPQGLIGKMVISRHGPAAVTPPS